MTEEMKIGEKTLPRVAFELVTIQVVGEMVMKIAQKLQSPKEEADKSLEELQSMMSLKHELTDKLLLAFDKASSHKDECLDLYKKMVRNYDEQIRILEERGKVQQERINLGHHCDKYERKMVKSLEDFEFLDGYVDKIDERLANVEKILKI